MTSIASSIVNEVVQVSFFSDYFSDVFFWEDFHTLLFINLKATPVYLMLIMTYQEIEVLMGRRL